MGPPNSTKKRSSLSPEFPPRLSSVVGGVDGWSHCDMRRMEVGRGFGAPLGYANDFQPTSPVRPRRDDSPASYCSIQNNPRNGDLRTGNGRTSMAIYHEESRYHNGWPGENKHEASLSDKGRPEDTYVGPHEYESLVNDTGRPQDNYARLHDHRPTMTNMGGPRDNYAGRNDYRPPLTNMGGSRDNYTGTHDYRTPTRDRGPPRYRQGSPRGHQMANNWM